MTHPLETEIRAQVIDYIVDGITLDEFKDWIVGETWELNEDDDPALTDLAYGVLLTLSEIGEDDQLLKRSLRRVVTDIRVSFGEPITTVSGSNTVAVTSGLTVSPETLAGRSPSGVFAS